MVKKKAPSDQSESGASSCNNRIKSMISVDERGQIILPKEFRDKANIKAGDEAGPSSLRKDGGYATYP